MATTHLTRPGKRIAPKVSPGMRPPWPVAAAIRAMRP